MKRVSIIHPPINPVVIGLIGGVYGIRGWVKIISFTDKVNNIFKYDPWFILFNDQWRLIHLEYWKVIKKHYIAKIVNVSSRECAKLLVQHKLIIDNSQLPYLYKADDYYWKDIVGCTVVTIHGNLLGKVIYIIETPVHDVLVVKVVNNNLFDVVDCLIPIIFKKIIKKVDLIKSIIIVDWTCNHV